MDHVSKSRVPDPLAKLAEQAIDTFVTSGRTLAAPTPIPQAMSKQAGVFVSIKKGGTLRGCIGTFFPSQPTIAHEIIANAIKSASADPRFSPIGEIELASLTVSVDVLSEPELCDETQLNPVRYGVLVESGWRRGLLLPDLEGVNTVADQLSIARDKAGIGRDEAVTLSRFTVERHG